MGIIALKHHFPHLRRCDLCHQAAHYLYQVQIGDIGCYFCSGAHADQALKNYNEKIEKGITPPADSQSGTMIEEGADYGTE